MALCYCVFLPIVRDERESVVAVFLLWRVLSNSCQNQQVVDFHVRGFQPIGVGEGGRGETSLLEFSILSRIKAR